MADIWKAVKEFLLSWKIKKEFEKINNLWDLYECIRDGKNLCDIFNHIMNYTYYKCVKSDNYSENRAIANISQFLSGCKMLLLMRDSELFEPADLYDALDLKKVFITLSLISRKDLCKKKKMKHFFCPTNMAPIILGSGEFMSPKIQSLSEQQHSEMSLYEAPNFMQTESLYMDTDNFLNFKSSFTITVEDQQNKYQHALAEFMKTEQNYFFYHLNLIGLIYDYLYERLSFSELEIIFNNFQNLKNAHNIICQSFKKICKEKKDQTVAYAIIKYKRHFLEYVPYVSKLNSSFKYAEKVWEDQKIQKGIHEIAKNYDSNLRIMSLKSLLILPMQHLARYQLHMDAMLKHCNNESHKIELRKGVEEIIDILTLIDKCKSDEEELQAIKLLESRLTIPKKLGCKFERLRDYGHKLFEAELKIAFLSDVTKMQIRTIILMDTRLIVARSFGNKLCLEQFFDIDEYKVTVGFGKDHKISDVKIESESQDPENNLKIILDDEDILKTSFLKMIDTFRVSNFLNAEDLKGHSLRLSNFEGFELCHLCGKFLHGLLCQGYKCVNGVCGIILHQSCLPKLKKCRSDNLMEKDGTKNLNKRNSSTKFLFSPSEVKSSLPEETLDSELWYNGNISRPQVTELFKDESDGYFIVRESLQGGNKYVLSFTFDQKVRHIVVQEKNGYFIKDFRCFPSVKELIAYYQIHSLKEAFSNYDTRLIKYPKARNNFTTIFFQFINKILASKTAKATKNAILYNSTCVDFKTGDKVGILSDFYLDIWVISINDKIGTALSYCFK